MTQTLTRVDGTAFGAGFPGDFLTPSPLESAAVARGSAEQYRMAAQLLIDHCSELGLNWSTANELDAVMVDLFNRLYSEGFGEGVGRKVFSAIGHLLPHVSRLGTWKLPRVHRALQGWRKLRPPQQRLPMPRFAALAIAALMVQKGYPSMALWVALVFSCYLRPSFLVSSNLRGAQPGRIGLPLFSSFLPDLRVCLSSCAN